MKKLILGVLISFFIVSCSSQKSADVADSKQQTSSQTISIPKPQNIQTELKSGKIIYKNNNQELFSKEIKYEEVYKNQISVLYKGDVEGVEFVGEFEDDLKLGVFNSSAKNKDEFEEDLKKLLKNPNVLMAEPNYEVSIDEDKPFVNDTQYSSLWGLQDINIEKAWENTFGDSQTIVAVVDTGVDYTHPDLSANMWINEKEIAGNKIDDDNNKIIDDIRGVDFVNWDTDPKDDHYHGTHVAGIVAAVANNALGVVGVAPKVKIMPVKVLSSSGGGSTLGIYYGFKYSVDNGAKIINASFGGRGFSYLMYYGAFYAYKNDVLIVAASGNSANNNDYTKIYPASYELDNIISVACVNQNNELSYFSNYGQKSVDIAAPGEWILSTTPNMGYTSLSGTSMAAPHVSGAAALVNSMRDNLSAISIKNYLLKYVKKQDALRTKLLSGGILDIGSTLSDPSLKITLKVSTSIPENNAKNVALDSDILLYFNYPLNCEDITKDNFYLLSNNSKIKGSSECNNTTLKFIPDENLTKDTKFELFLLKNIHSSKKKIFPLQNDFNTTFYTKSISKNTILEEGITYPIDGAKDVPLGVIIKVNLDNELSLDDIISMEFSLKDSAGTKIEGKKAVYSNYVTFTPNTLLQPSQKYSAYFNLPFQKVTHNFSFTTVNY